MKRSSIFTLALAATAALTTAVWAQHGGGPPSQGAAAGHGGPPPSVAGDSSHAANGSAHQNANAPNTGSANAADFESRLANNRICLHACNLYCLPT